MMIQFCLVRGRPAVTENFSIIQKHRLIICSQSSCRCVALQELCKCLILDIPISTCTEHTIGLYSNNFLLTFLLKYLL
jgi:hypothetical protein